MVEDVIARSHQVLDTLNEQDGLIGLSALHTLSASQPYAGPFARLIGIEFKELSAGVITSYSIHYTKLYETETAAPPQTESARAKAIPP